MMSTPEPASDLAKSTRPVLSDADSRARVMRRRWLTMRYGLPHDVGGWVCCKVCIYRTSTGSWARVRAAVSARPPGGGGVDGYGGKFAFAAQPQGRGRGSERQFRRVSPFWAGSGRRRRGVPEGPAHLTVAAGMTVDHDLHRAPRSVWSGQQHAFLDLPRFAVGIERPHFAIRQQQDDAASVR